MNSCDPIQEAIALLGDASRLMMLAAEMAEANHDPNAETYRSFGHRIGLVEEEIMDHEGMNWS